VILHVPPLITTEGRADSLNEFMSYQKWSEGHTEFGRGDLALPLLIDFWAMRTLVFRNQASEADPPEYPWGIDDIIGTYHVRDAVQQALWTIDAQPPRPVGQSGVATLDAVDLLWADFCLPGARPALQNYSPESFPLPPSVWWWDLAPRTGVVRQDLDRLPTIADESTRASKD